jgi:subtilisin family serine protease
MKRLIPLLVCFFALAASGSVVAQTVRIDPRVLADTADGAKAHFLVVLRSQTNSRALAAAEPDRAARVRVVFDALRRAANATQPAIRAQLDALGAKYRAFYIVNAFAVEGDRAVVNALAARGDVLAVESDRAFRVNLESTAGAAATANGIEWNVSKINAASVWSLGYTGQNMVYANADTGVQWDHPALKSHYRGWNGMSADHNYNWWDAIRDGSIGGGSECGYATAVPCDDHGHGTHTMGIGIGDDGAENRIGVAPGAQWIACRNMDNGVGRPSTYIECMEFFLAPWDLNKLDADPNKRPHAVGNSYGCPPSEQCLPNSLLAAMDNLRAAGVFMAVAAGNSGSGCGTVSDPPAIYDSAISVGATDQNDVIAGFSSRGPVTVDGSNRGKPDLVAPGVSVRSSVPTNGYGSSSGTSMASPHVAGAVVLFWSAFPALVRNVDLTESVLIMTAVPLVTSQACGSDVAYQYPNNVYGAGRLDVLAAYNYYARIGPPPYLFYIPVILKNH